MFTKLEIFKYGVLAAFTYWALTIIFCQLFGNIVLLFSFYFPGAIYGFYLTTPLGRKKETDPALLTIFSILIYFFVILFCNKNIPGFIQVRLILSPGIGGLLLLLTISIIYKLKINLVDIVLIFILGIATTFYSRTDTSGPLNPWKLYFAIGLWQLAFSFYINLVVNRQTKKPL